MLKKKRKSNLSHWQLTSWVQPLDQGIIRAVKADYRKLHIRWILAMLDAGKFENANKARVDIRSALEWARTVWVELSQETVRNCWNRAKILSKQVVGEGPDDEVITENAKGSILQVEDVVDDPGPQSCGLKLQWNQIQMRRMLNKLEGQLLQGVRNQT
jgi:hypothetical protein